MATLIAKPTVVPAVGSKPKVIELAGTLRVDSRDAQGVVSHLDVHASQGVIATRGQWVRYSTPGAQGAEYVAVCLPSFSPSTVQRDAS